MSVPFDAQITFLAVADLERSAHFYGDVLGLDLVLDQGDCRIFRVTGTAYLGICVRPNAQQRDGVIVTLVTADVAGWHDRITTGGGVCQTPPRAHPDYAIYQAFYRDPDGYLIEVQRFDDPDWANPI